MISSRKVMPLHLLCGKDANRPETEHIYFKKGYAYTFETHVCSKVHIKNQLLPKINELEMQLLEGKAIHKETFILITKHKNFSVDDSGIVITDKAGTNLHCKFASDRGVRMPDIDQLLNYNTIAVPVERMGFNIELLMRVQQVSNYEGDKPLEMYFFGEKKGVICLRPKVLRTDFQIMAMPWPINREDEDALAITAKKADEVKADEDNYDDLL